MYTSDLRQRIKAAEVAVSDRADDSEDRSKLSIGATCRVVACCCGVAVAVAAYLGIIIVLWGVLGPTWVPERVVATRVTVPITRLHPALANFTIAQLSDVHFNDNNSIEMGVSDNMLEQAINIINQSDVDLVVMTGKGRLKAECGTVMQNTVLGSRRLRGSLATRGGGVG
jgi:hypothetical protein